MIAIIIILSIISISCLCLSIFLFIYSKRLARWVYNIQKILNELNKETIPIIRNEIVDLQNNPPEFTKRFSMVDFRLKKMEDILSTFNNGFKYNEAWMR